DRDKLFHTSHGNLIAGWCIDHFRKHKEAPGKAIMTYYAEWAQTARDETEARLVNMVLQNLDAEFTEAALAEDTTAHRLEVAESHSTRGRSELSLLQGRNGHLDKTIDKLTNFKPIRLVAADGVAAKDIEPEQVYWLWPGWLAYGEMAMLDGLPGEGK